jgi:hypothetical protein
LAGWRKGLVAWKGGRCLFRKDGRFSLRFCEVVVNVLELDSVLRCTDTGVGDGVEVVSYAFADDA